MYRSVLIVAAIIIFNVAFYYVDGPAHLERWLFGEPLKTEIDITTVEVFMYALNDEVVTKLGHPEQGFTPTEYLQALPGLVPTDFDNVQAQLGHYAIVGGQLVHIRAEQRLQHQYVKVVTVPGMEQLLRNVLDRTGLDLAGDDTITDVINAVVHEQQPL